MEKHRLECVRKWAESPYQRATLRAILDTLERLGVSSGPVLVPARSKPIPIAA